jgi:hypothetical protein
MHLHGRALQRLLPRAVADIDGSGELASPNPSSRGVSGGFPPSIDDYEYLDGEIVAGIVLGWNFGDGHLHDLQLLRAVQRQCGFTEGELRCVFVEAQPMGRPTLAWTIADAASGVRERGEVAVSELRALQPWPAS